MRQLTFVTTNDIKYNTAAHMLQLEGIELQRQQLDFEEIQAEDGEPIARHKAEQAYKALQQPVLVTDDSWLIHGLNGFPGPYMKDISEWLTNEDLLRLTLPLKDRRVTLRQHAVYQDGIGQHYFVADVEARLLSEIRGSSKSSILEIISFSNSTRSHAEEIANGNLTVTNKLPTVWRLVADWAKQT